MAAAARSRDPGEAARRLARAGVAVAVLMVGMAVAHTAFTALGAAAVLDPREAGAAALGFVALPVLAMRRLWPDGASLAVQGSWRLAIGAWAAFMVVCVPIAVLGYGAALRWFGESLPAQPLLAYFAEVRSPGRLLATSVVVCVLGPLTEEIVFRGYVQGALREASGPWVAIVGTAVLFGLVHGPLYAAPIGLLGVLFGWLRERCDSLGPAVVAHGMHNGATVLLVVLWPGLVEELFGGRFR